MGDYREYMEDAITNLRRMADEPDRAPVHIRAEKAIAWHTGKTRAPSTGIELGTLVDELETAWREYLDARRRGHA